MTFADIGSAGRLSRLVPWTGFPLCFINFQTSFMCIINFYIIYDLIYITWPVSTTLLPSTYQNAPDIDSIIDPVNVSSATPYFESLIFSVLSNCFGVRYLRRQFSETSFALTFQCNIYHWISKIIILLPSLILSWYFFILPINNFPEFPFFTLGTIPFEFFFIERRILIRPPSFQFLSAVDN